MKHTRRRLGRPQRIDRLIDALVHNLSDLSIDSVAGRSPATAPMIEIVVRLRQFGELRLAPSVREQHLARVHACLEQQP